MVGSTCTKLQHIWVHFNMLQNLHMGFPKEITLQVWLSSPLSGTLASAKSVSVSHACTNITLSFSLKVFRLRLVGWREEGREGREEG